MKVNDPTIKAKNELWNKKLRGILTDNKSFFNPRRSCTLYSYYLWNSINHKISFKTKEPCIKYRKLTYKELQTLLPQSKYHK
jgi:hypothetical protein